MRIWAKAKAKPSMVAALLTEQRWPVQFRWCAAESQYLTLGASDVILATELSNTAH
jgi:hypothetical protein